MIKCQMSGSEKDKIMARVVRKTSLRKKGLSISS